MKIKQIIFTCLAAGLMAAFFTTVQAQNNSNGSNALTGGWKVRVTSNDPGVPAFDELITFDAGGGLVETNNLFPNTFFNQNASPGHGSWRFDRRNKYSFTFIKLLFNLRTNEPIGTLTVRGVITLRTPSMWEGPANVTIEDPNGNVILRGSSYTN
jgi:hypothetical protein